MSLARVSVADLRHAADACVRDVPFYEEHPDARVEFRRLATAELVRALCDHWLAEQPALERPEVPRIDCWCPKCRTARGIE